MKSLSSHPHDQINFLPDWYVQAERSRASRRRQIVLIAVMVAGMAFLWVITTHRKSQLSEYLAALEDQIATAEGQITEVMKLQNEKRSLARQVRIYRQIARPLNYSQISGTLAAYMPPEISLTELYAHTEVIEQTRPAGDLRSGPANATRGKRNNTITTSYPVVVVEVEGSAPSNVDIANFVGRLAGSGLFRNVKMIHSRQGENADIITRRFKVAMEVPLNVIYHPPGVEEVAHAD